MKAKRIQQGFLHTTGLGVLLLCLALSVSWTGSPDLAQATDPVPWARQHGLAPAQPVGAEIAAQTIVVSRASDPYFSLAQKIAAADHLDIVDEFAAALEASPTYVILVASPDNLSAETLLDIGRAMKRSGLYPGTGIITASTLEKAEQLWARAELAQEGDNYLGGDVEVTQQVFEPTLFPISDGPNQPVPLTKATLIEALKQAGYFYWARHVGQVTWFWNSESPDWGEDDELRAHEIPPLGPVAIYTPSCGSLRPWLEDSISLGFIDQGAAAYIGNANSPFHTAAILRHGLAVPGITSWQEFPLSLVAQIENKADVKAYFRLPQMFMLGDPRLYLSSEQPYQIVSDQLADERTRLIDGTSSHQGILALKIENGSQYDFVTVRGLTSAGEHDLFHNNRLQTLNLGAGKYMLFPHKGGDFRIVLAPKPPLGWTVADALVDAFDYSWVVMWLDVKVVNAPFLYVLSLVIFAAILFVMLVRRKRPIAEYRAIFAIGALFALLRVIYPLVRFDDYSVSANLIDLSAYSMVFGYIGVFANVVGGLMIMKDAKKVAGKLVGLAFTVFPQFVLAAFYLAFITFMNAVPQLTRTTAPWLWNYYAFWLALTALLLEAALIAALYRLFVSPARLPLRKWRIAQASAKM